jgi:hypothetical protein
MKVQIRQVTWRFRLDRFHCTWFIKIIMQIFQKSNYQSFFIMQLGIDKTFPCFLGVYSYLYSCEHILNDRAFNFNTASTVSFYETAKNYGCIMVWHCHNIFLIVSVNKWGPSWSFGSWIYNYMCNQCLSPLKLWVQIQLRWGVHDTTLCDKVCQWLVTGL